MGRGFTPSNVRNYKWWSFAPKSPLLEITSTALGKGNWRVLEGGDLHGKIFPTPHMAITALISSNPQCLTMHAEKFPFAYSLTL
jgi:hypothetical protein